jgi:hypothetical protein
MMKTFGMRLMEARERETSYRLERLRGFPRKFTSQQHNQQRIVSTCLLCKSFVEFSFKSEGDDEMEDEEERHKVVKKII